MQHDLFRRELPANINGGCRTHRSSAIRFDGRHPQPVGTRQCAAVAPARRSAFLLTKATSSIRPVIEGHECLTRSISAEESITPSPHAEAERKSSKSCVFVIIRLVAAVIVTATAGLFWNRTTAEFECCPPLWRSTVRGRLPSVCHSPFQGRASLIATEYTFMNLRRFLT